MAGAPKCHPANRFFHDHLERLRLDAGSKGYYSQASTYRKALQALRRYPLPLRTSHEVSDLEGMGKACCRIFEECRLKESKKPQNLPNPEGDGDGLWRENCKKRLLKALKDATKGASASKVPLRSVSLARPLRGKGKGKGKGKSRGRGRGRGRPGVPSMQQSSPRNQFSPSVPRVPQDNEDDLPLCDVMSPLLATPERPTRLGCASPQHSPLPLTGGCELLHAAASGGSQFEKFEFQGRGSTPPPRRPLRRSASAPEADTAAPKAKRQLVATRSEPPNPPLPKPRLAVQHAPLELRSFESPGKLVLLLDHREVGASKEHALKGAMFAELQKRLGADSVEARVLPLGDVLWIWRNATGEELICGWIVERKTFPDLSSSICDGRYEEQKGRLLDAPHIQGVVFLVEGHGPLFGVEDSVQSPARGFGQRLGPRLSEKALSSSATHTQLISGFNVLHSASIPHSVSLLVALHSALAKQSGGVQGDAGGWVSYDDFAERTKKHGQRRVFEAFGRMLRMVPGCGAEATEALVDEFQTPQAFAAALGNFSDSELLLRLKQRGGRVTTPVLQHCRRLYCGA